MSRILNRGIGSRIFAGFVVQIAIGVLVGVAGFWSLRGVIDSSNLNQTAGEVQTRILQARALEKEYILKKDPQSYGNLIKTLDQLEAETIHLKNSMHQSGSADEIARTAQVYRGAAAQLKSLEESDAVVLQKLQMTATNIARMSEEESGKAARETAATIVEANAKTLKDTALKRIEDIVQTAHDVLKFHHERGLSFENALEVIRAMHFDGDNYFFVVGENLTLVAHGMDRGLEGLDFGTIQDKKTGKTFMKEVVDSAIKKGESYTEYYWTKPGQGEAIFPKITFGRYYKPWGVVICAGVYTEDIQAEIARTEALIKTGLKKLEDANAINANALNARLNAVYYFAFQQNADEVADYLQRLKSLPLATDALRAEADKYLADFQKRFEGNQKRQQEIQRIDEIAGRSTAAISEVSTMARDSASTSASSGKTFMMVFVFAGALGGIIIAILLLRAITGPIRKAISGVYSAAEQVLDASSQIADSSQQLAEGASEQASSLEETSSALEEMASMTKQNAASANQAKILSVNANEISGRANGSMGKLMASMNEIAGASEETQKIVKTIDEIAFQTNLLALNAAVEAARAGEAGAGFAVVADEVRNLAMRAADAAKTTAELIETTTRKVREGSVLVEETHKGFEEVISIVSRSGALVNEIAAGSEEQAQGIEQINRAMSEMDKVTQQNASHAEQSAAASGEMTAQAEQMKRFVDGMAALVGGQLANGNGTGKEASGSGAALPLPHRRLISGSSDNLLDSPAAHYGHRTGKPSPGEEGMGTF